MAFKSTSIKGSNVAILDQSGKIGTVRYFVRNGQTYVRAAKNKTTASSNPRSDAQMKTRLKHNSMLAIWKKLQPYMNGAFQNKEVNQSDYNAFMQENAGKGIYMTKEQFNAGCGVLLPVTISSGIPSVFISTDTYGVALPFNHVTLAEAPTTVGGFSQVLYDEHGFENGDKITIIGLRQNSDNLTPTILGAEIKQFVVDTTSTEALPSWIVFDADLSGCTLMVNSSVTDKFMAGAIAYKGGKIMSSTVTCKNTTLISSFSSDTQFQLARDSYGKAKKTFLK